MKKHLNNGFIMTLLLTGALTSGVLPRALAQDQKLSAGEGTHPPVTVPYTEMRSFYSKLLDREMAIYVKLPVSYYEHSDRVYQGWYFTDANRSFPMLANMINVFEIPRPSQPEMVLIGIGYKIDEMVDFFALRTRDLTQVNDPGADEYWKSTISSVAGREIEVRTGGAPLFLEFITRELFPFIESNYRVSTSDRCLGGYSFGGLFTLYVMFTKPELFTKYYAGSPAISFSYGSIYESEEEYASKHHDLHAKLLMTMGGLEEASKIADMTQMAELLQSRGYPSLTVETNIFPGEWHQSCGAASLMKAIVVLNTD